MPPPLEMQGLTKHYRGVVALDDCTLSVRPGEVYGLLGPNGSGKTTLLRLVMGFLRPTRGQATIQGRDCSRETVAVHRLVAYLPGDVRLFRHLRARSVLRYFAGTHPGGSYARATQLAERLDLDLSRAVASMSTGMRQKLALAAVLSIDAPLVILDEPTSNLDPTIRADVIAMVGEAQAAGRTVIFSSHVLDEVEMACDRVGLLRAGRLVHEQRMSELRGRHHIRARLTGLLPPMPPELNGSINIRTVGAHMSLLAPPDLSPLLGWLGTLPLADVRIEPIGLREVYERFHTASPAGRA